ncbi:UNVERIFIED_CONTAM: hypothetical protein HHA_281530 [Hammondia hammondi]|eukprot:XP_008887613.1 hypothetical protein HHA_281530 [Hammondia hammondi]
MANRVIWRSRSSGAAALQGRFLESREHWRTGEEGLGAGKRGTENNKPENRRKPAWSADRGGRLDSGEAERGKTPSSEEGMHLTVTVSAGD